MTSLVAQLLARSMGVLLGALLLIGLGTGALLYALEVRAVDRTLLAAASAFGDEGERQAEHVVSPVWVGWADRSSIPASWIAQVIRTERPMWVDTGDQRVLLLLLEGEHEEEERDHHRVVAAAAPRPTLLRTVGPFALAYAVAAGLVAMGASLAQGRLLRGAVRPLSDAVRSVERTAGAAVGTRLSPTGPDEVRALLAAVDGLLVRRDDAFRAQSRFTAAAAHELRTPVTALLGEIEVTLRRPRDGAAYATALVAVHQEVRRMAALVEGLLLLSRVDAGQAEQNRTREHVGALIQEAARREGPTIEAAGGKLRIEAGPDPEVEVHPALLVAAIANLLRNGAVHAPGATVTVRTEDRGDAVAVVVEDDGPGFAAAPTFERRPEGGLGLGLPLTREIARRHGGDCRAVPRARGGAVELTLPVPDRADG